MFFTTSIAVQPLPVASHSSRAFSCLALGDHQRWRSNVRNPVAGPDRRLRRSSGRVAFEPRASRPLTAAEQRWLLDQMSRRVSVQGAAANPAVGPRGTAAMMMGRPSAQTAVAPVTSLPATGHELASSAASSVVPGAGAAPVAPGTAGENATSGRGETRMELGVMATKYRAFFACASHARDTSTDGQLS